MTCPNQEICGGCSRRNMDEATYQAHKYEKFMSLMKGLKQDNVRFGTPIFVQDNTRRRASMAFHYRKGNVILGFNSAKSNVLVNCENCLLLTPKINANLDNIREMLIEICKIPIIEKGKGKKFNSITIADGDVWICEADNGLDIVLEFDKKLELGHRMVIFELTQKFDDVIRVSHRRKTGEEAEPIVEKIKPFIKIANTEVYIPAGTFLQPSKQGEQALVDLVMKYLDNTEGKIADLFCGVGTFSYPLAVNRKNKITAVDSSASLLEGFRQTVNRNIIPNIEILTKNLFKYPLDEKELETFEAVVFDPPRAGASAQVVKLAAVSAEKKPSKVIAVSCNPHSFIKDANILIDGDYNLQEVTFVDQFIYSDHNELVALFTK